MKNMPWKNVENPNLIDLEMTFSPNKKSSASTLAQETLNLNFAQDKYKHKHKDIHEVESDKEINKYPINLKTEKALALKYRPQIFKDLIGQEVTKNTLVRALDSQKINHAYLFSGIRGSGKTSSARILARSIQCDVGISSLPCGECESCKSALNGSNIDIIEMDGASNRKIEDIRDLIEQTKYKPTRSRFKIFIIDEVHMLTKEAFNALLKTLEEPPSYVKFILATTDPLKLPFTILSRVQHFRFKKIATNILKDHLSNILVKEKIEFQEKALDLIVRNASGSVRDCLTLLDQIIIYSEGNITLNKVSEVIGLFDIAIMEQFFEAILKENKELSLQIAKKLSEFEIITVIEELSIYVKDKLLDNSLAPILGFRYANILNDAREMIRLDCDNEFCMILIALKMIEANNLSNIKDVIETIESDEDATKKLKELQKNTQFSEIENEKNDDHKYQKLISKLYDRDFVIGKIYQEKIKFLSFKDNILNLEFSTNEEETITLRNGYKGTLELIREIFGNNTKLSVVKKKIEIDKGQKQEIIKSIQDNLKIKETSLVDINDILSKK